jgi:hypothetical protein
MAGLDLPKYLGRMAEVAADEKAGENSEKSDS